MFLRRCSYIWIERSPTPEAAEYDYEVEFVKSYGCYELSFYGASFYKEGKPVAQFVPVVKDGVAGIYDKVAKKFFASSTDVPLVAGPRNVRSEVEDGNGKLRSQPSTSDLGPLHA